MKQSLQECFMTFRNKIQRQNTAHMDRELANFLPDTLAIEASPPHPLAKLFLWILISLFVLASIWSVIGKIDIVASADGKIIPTSRVKKIQPLQAAIVKKILVKEGDIVVEGQALVELDNTLTQADQKKLEHKLFTGEVQLALEHHLLNWQKQKQLNKNALREELKKIKDISAYDIYINVELAHQKFLTFQAERNKRLNQIIKNETEQQTAHKKIEKIRKILPIEQKNFAAINTLYKQQFSSENEYLKAKKTIVDLEQNLMIELSLVQQLIAQQKLLEQELQSFLANNMVESMTTINELKAGIVEIENELLQAKSLNKNQMLYAPISGQVLELAIHTQGGVVTSAQQLMLIVPLDKKIEVEVLVENKDIGFIETDMPAEIKIHTFPFTKYGVVEAQILSISQDAILDEQKGLLYKMRLLLNQTTLLVENRNVPLQAGMTVTAEVQTGQRRIIEFLLAPLLKRSQESLRER